MPAYLPIVSKFDAKGIKKAESSVKKFGKVASGIAAGATAAHTGIAEAGVREYAKFDSALNQSLAIMGDVSTALRDDMAATAREVAKTTSFSAEQAAESYFFLASAGLDAEQQIAAMPQVAAFAQAGMFDMALATDLATDAQSALGLASDDAGENLDNLTRITDVFVKANTLANTSVEQLATAFTTKSGTALKSVGKDVEEGAAALAVFADQGIKGERAGTLLTNTIFGFTDVMKKAPAEAEALGLKIFDAAGNMRSMADISENLTDVLGPMSTEQRVATLSALGFTKQAREGALAMIGNADSMREYESALRDAGGTTQEVADKQMVTLEAQLGLLKDEFKDVGISVGQELAPSFADLVKNLKPMISDLGPVLVDAFKGLIPVIESVAGMIPRLIPLFAALIPVIFQIVEVVLRLAEIVLPILIDIFAQLMPVIKSLMPVFIGLVTDVVKPLADAFFELITQMLPMITQVIPPMIELVKMLLPVFTELIIAVVTPLIPLVLKLVEAFMPFIEMVLPLITSLLTNFVIPVLTGLAGFLTGVLIFAVERTIGMMNFFAEAAQNVGNFFQSMWQDFIQPALQALGDFFTDIFENVLTPIFDGFLIAFGLIAGVVQMVFENVVMPMLEMFGSFFTDLFNNVVEPAAKTGEKVFEGLGAAWKWVYENVIQPVLDFFATGFQNLYDIFIKPIADMISGAFEVVGDVTEDVFQGVSDFMKSIFEGLVNIVRHPLNLIIGFINNVIEALNTISVEIPWWVPEFGGKKFGLNIPRVAEIPALADGGIVMPRPGGVLAQIAEAGSPEAVIPLDRMNDFGGSTYNITINAGVGSDPVSIGRYVTDAIKRYESVSGKVFATA